MAKDDDLYGKYDDTLSPADISKLSSVLKRQESTNRKDIGSLSRSVSFLTEQQKEASKLLETRDIGYAGGIKEIEKSTNKILGKLGYLVTDITKTAKKILLTTAATTKQTLLQYGQALNADFRFNKSNFVGMLIAKASPIFGYFAAKFMETDVFSKFRERIQDGFIKTWHKMTGGDRRLTFGEVLKFPFKVAKELIKLPFKVIGTILIGLAKLPFKAISFAFKTFFKTVKFLAELPFKAIGVAIRGFIGFSKFLVSIPLKIASLPFKLIGGAWRALKSGLGFGAPKAQKGGYVKKGGLVETHAGELIAPADKFMDKMKEIFDPVVIQLKTMTGILRMFQYYFIPLKDQIKAAVAGRALGTRLGRAAVYTTSLWMNRKDIQEAIKVSRDKAKLFYDLVKYRESGWVGNSLELLMGIKTKQELENYKEMIVKSRIIEETKQKATRGIAKTTGYAKSKYYGLRNRSFRKGMTEQPGASNLSSFSIPGIGNMDIPMFAEYPEISQSIIQVSKTQSDAIKRISAGVTRYIQAANSGKIPLSFSMVSDIGTDSGRQMLQGQIKGMFDKLKSGVEQEISSSRKGAISRTGEMPGEERGTLPYLMWQAKVLARMVPGLTWKAGKETVKTSWKGAGGTVRGLRSGISGLWKGKGDIAQLLKNDIGAVGSDIQSRYGGFLGSHPEIARKLEESKLKSALWWEKHPRLKKDKDTVIGWFKRKNKEAKEEKKERESIQEIASNTKKPKWKDLIIKGLLFLPSVLGSVGKMLFKIPVIGGLLRFATAITKFGGKTIFTLIKWIPSVAKWGVRMGGIISGLWVLTDFIRGIFGAKETFGAGGMSKRITSGIGTAVGGKGTGFGNAIKQSFKWGSIGFLFGGPPGLLIGALAGGLLGFVGGEKIALGTQFIYTVMKRIGKSIGGGLGLIKDLVISIGSYAVSKITGFIDAIFEWIASKVPFVGKFLKKAGEVKTAVGGKVTGAIEATRNWGAGWSENARTAIRAQEEAITREEESRKSASDWLRRRKRHSGGLITGNGPEVPIMAQPGEYILNKSLTSKLLGGANQYGTNAQSMLSGRRNVSRFEGILINLGNQISNSIGKGFEEISLGMSPFGGMMGGVAKTGRAFASYAGRKIKSGAKAVGTGISTGVGAVSKAIGNMLGFKPMAGVNLEHINPQVLDPFKAMAAEYTQKTGKVIPVTSGWRSSAKQKSLYEEKHGRGVAKPGLSMHEYGWAMDIDSRSANELASMGLLDKYGFTRPYLNSPTYKEAWHLEPTGIQGNRQAIRDRYSNMRSMVGDGEGGLGKVKIGNKQIAAREVSNAMVPLELLSKGNGDLAKQLGTTTNSAMNAAFNNMTHISQIMTKNASSQGNQQGSSYDDRFIRDILEGNFPA